MANITLGQLRDLWKNVSDWVTGAATHEPKVQLSGSSEAIPVAVQGKSTRLLDQVAVTAGSSMGFLPLNISGPFAILSMAIRLDAPRSFQVVIRHHDPFSGLIVRNETAVIDRRDSPNDRDAGYADLYTNQVQWSVRNEDTEDLIVRTLVATEFYAAR